jgi:adenylate cyclase
LTEGPGGGRSFWTELKRRKVVRVVVVYAATAFVVLQAADLLAKGLGLPAWLFPTVTVLVVLGFPVALVLGWALELTPDGVRITPAAATDRDAAPPSLVGRGTLLIAGVLVVLGVGIGTGWFLRPTGSQADRGDSLVSMGLSAVPASWGEHSVAVLPFANLSDDPEQGYFADGLSEEIRNQVAQVQEIRVLDRTSSFASRGGELDARGLGQRLGVTHVLDGSVRRAGDRLRVIAQLVRTEDGTQIWSQSYDGGMGDVFVIQDDVAASVVRALEVVLDEPTRERMQRVGVRNVDAFIAFQRGLEAYGQAHLTGDLGPPMQEANRHFEEAIRLVPDFAMAWFQSADLYQHIVLDGSADDPRLGDARREVLIRLDEAFRHARDPAVRMFVDVDRVLFSDDWTPLDARVRRALAFEGCPFPIWIQNLIPFYASEETLALWTRRAACDPDNVLAYGMKASVLGAMGRSEEALALLEHAAGLHGDSPYLRTFRFTALLQLRRTDDARELVRDVSLENPILGPYAHVMLPAAEADLAGARANMEKILGQGRGVPAFLLAAAATTGDRALVNRLASEADARPAGPFLLVFSALVCGCGAPFDLEATPNLRARLGESGLPWPPPTLVEFPLKDW